MTITISVAHLGLRPTSLRKLLADVSRLVTNGYINEWCRERPKPCVPSTRMFFPASNASFISVATSTRKLLSCDTWLASVTFGWRRTFPAVAAPVPERVEETRFRNLSFISSSRWLRVMTAAKGTTPNSLVFQPKPANFPKKYGRIHESASGHEKPNRRINDCRRNLADYL